MTVGSRLAEKPDNFLFDVKLPKLFSRPDGLRAVLSLKAWLEQISAYASNCKLCNFGERFPVRRLQDDFQRRDLVAFKLKKESKVNGAAGKVSDQMAGDDRLPVLLFACQGSHVYSYFAEASVFHSLIAARPLWVRLSSFTTAFAVKHCEPAFPSTSSAMK